ncbi:MAG: hypothetical protein J5746_07735 [Victivallales bacterium]|nr:hypothetical protein [Victivallales bacterium]
MEKLSNIAVFLQHDVVPSWQISDRQAQRLRDSLPGVAVNVCRSEAAFLEALPQADCTMVWRFKQEWLERASRLKLLSTPAAGRDYFKITPPAGLRMMYGQFHGILISETVLGFLLGMCRGILPAVTQLAKEEWPRPQLAAEMRPLRGSTVTILGYGNIGRHIEKLLLPLGVNVIGVRHRAGQGCVGLEELDSVLPKTDHLVIALPGTDENRHFVDKAMLAKLPRHATVVNIGRGMVLDQEALVDALEQGKLSAACLDVFEEEPLPMETRLRCCQRLWRMPHASAISPDYLDLYIDDFLRQL